MSKPDTIPDAPAIVRTAADELADAGAVLRFGAEVAHMAGLRLAVAMPTPRDPEVAAVLSVLDGLSVTLSLAADRATR